MINMATMEGVLCVKPVLLEGRAGAVTEFNLEHSDLTGAEPARYIWRCKAIGALAHTIAERGSKGQRLVVQGKFVQEMVAGNGGQSFTVVKLLLQDVSFGQSSWGAN